MESLESRVPSSHTTQSNPQSTPQSAQYAPSSQGRRDGVLTFSASPDAPVLATDDRAVQAGATLRYLATLADGAGHSLAFGSLREIHLSSRRSSCFARVDQDVSGHHHLSGALTFSDVDPSDLAAHVGDAR